LLYVDQWEELYAQGPSPSVEKDRAARHAADGIRFIDLLLNASQSAPVSVVATVRADFYDPLISHHKIQALLPTQQVLLGSMSRAELESTIVEPAKMVGLTIDPPKLVSQILDEAGEDEGMLPLLQYAPGFMRCRGVVPGGLGVNRNDARHYCRESACGGTLSPCRRFRPSASENCATRNRVENSLGCPLRHA
jgi:hypothetical protein